jgi:hypothetical protein
MRDKFLIRMMTWEDNKNYPTMIKGFFSNSITEFLKLYNEAKENEIIIDIPEENEEHSKFDGKEAYVKELRIGFGGNEAITCLDVYVDVV